MDNQNTTPVQTPVQPVAAQTKSGSKTMFFVLGCLLLLCCAISVGAAIIVAVGNDKDKTEDTRDDEKKDGNTTPTTTPTSDDNKTTPTSAPTTVQIPSGFKSYEDKDAGISFAYPSDWAFSDTPPSGSASLSPLFVGIMTTPTGYSSDAGKENIISSRLNLDIESEAQAFLDDAPTSGYDNFRLIDKKELTINSYDALMIDCSYTLSNTSIISRQYYVEKGSDSYLFLLTATNQADFDKAKADMDKIVNTVELTK